MAKQTVNIGLSPNDGTGDQLRTAFDKINDNFDELYDNGLSGSNLSVTSNTISSLDTNGNIILDPNGLGRVQITGNSLTISVSKTPATSIGSPGDVAGMITWDTSYIYVCVFDYDGSTQIWRRSLATSW